MGAHRKTQIFSLKYSPGGTTPARDLIKNDLGSVIFGCTHRTMKECIQNHIFGLPASHWSYVANIEPGLPLFLFNYSDRKMHGIFEAASSGQMNINPHGWTADDLGKKTQYPAQVRIRIRKQCQSLPEKRYKSILGDNYYGNTHHFQFELDHAQTEALLSLFESSPTVTALPSNAPKPRNLQEVLNKDCKDKPETLKSPEKKAFSDGNALRWVKRIKETPEADAITVDENLKVLEGDTEHPESGNMGIEPLKESEAIHHPETQLQVQVMGSDEEIVLWKLEQMTLDKEASNSCPINQMAEAFVPSRTSETQQVAACSSEAVSVAEKCENVLSNSIDFQSVIDQLKHEMEELKALSVDQLTKSTALEKKLECSDTEVQRLRDRVNILESLLKGTSTTCIYEPSESYYVQTLTEPFQETQLSVKDLVFVMGGIDADDSWLSTLECYSTSKDVVRSLLPMSSARSYSTAAVSNGYIFNIGGCGPSGHSDSSLWYDTVECYNPSTNEWTLCPSLSERKGCLAGATLRDKIFAFGGGDGVECSSKVEMLDPAFDRWILMASMLQKRFAAAAAELDGALYVVGGFYDGNYLKSAERFDPREPSWSRLQSMNTSRCSHSLAVLNEKLYALGGHDGSKMLSSVEVFDPRIGSWLVDADMNLSRAHFFAPVIGETIYTIGGRKEFGISADAVECYKGRGWSVTKLKGIGKRAFFSATLL